MLVHNISDNQQTFNGYVDKKLKKSIRKDLLKPVKILKDCKTDLKKERYKVLLGQGERTLEKLEKFVAPLHKDTSIEMYDNRYLRLSNPITTGRAISYPCASGIIIRDELGFRENKARLALDKDIIYADVYTDIDKNNASRYLEKIELVMDAINKYIKPKEINEAFLKLAERDLREYSYDNYTGISFIDKFLINRVVKEIEKYAESIGKTTEAKTIAENRLKELKEIHSRRADEQKIGNKIKRALEKIKRGFEKISKNKRTAEDKQYISEVNKLVENKSKNIQTTTDKSPKEVVQK